MNAMRSAIQNALRTLQQQQTLLYPTDTIWGIGCDATNEAAVQRIVEIKGRGEDKSFIVLVSDMDMLRECVELVPEHATRVMHDQQGPLTIIYPKGKNVAPQVLANDGSIAVRISNDVFCKELITQFGRPIISTSANRSGSPSPACFEDIEAKIKAAVDHVVTLRQDENGPAKASTIIKLGLHGEIDIIRR